MPRLRLEANRRHSPNNDHAHIADATSAVREAKAEPDESNGKGG